MEACVLGRIKSDGYRFLAKIYGLIWEVVQKTKNIELNADDKGYVAFFLKHLNQFELLKRQKHKLLCLVMGYLENAKRHFKRDSFRMSFDEPNWQIDTIHDYRRYYNDRMQQSENGKLLLIEKAVVAREVGKLIKYYNYLFYAENCPEAIRYFYNDTTQAVLGLPKQDEIKDKFLNQTKHFEYCPYSADEADDFSYMPDIVKEAIITHVPQSIICKIVDKNEPYIPPVLIDHGKEKREASIKKQMEAYANASSEPPRQTSSATPPKEENLERTNLPQQFPCIKGVSAGRGGFSHDGKEEIVVKSPLTPAPLPQGERDSTAADSTNPEPPKEECGIPDDIIHTLGSLSVSTPSFKSKDITEYYTLEEKIKKAYIHIEQAKSNNIPATELMSYNTKLLLRQELIKRRLASQHNYEIKRDTEGIG